MPKKLIVEEHSTGEFCDPFGDFVIDYDPAHKGYWIIYKSGEVVATLNTYDQALDWISGCHQTLNWAGGEAIES